MSVAKVSALSKRFFRARLFCTRRWSVFIAMSYMASALPAAAVSLEDIQELKDSELAKLSKSQLKVESGEQTLPVFGSQLFDGSGMGQSRKVANPDYRVVPGDQIRVSVWGATDFNESFIVDNRGNIVLPTVGPVEVKGVPYSRLNQKLTSAVRSVYADDVGVYAELASAQQIGIFVTGDAARPGRYSGSSSDSVLQFLARAGGPNPESGSFRNIEVRRGERRIARVDLYAFLLDGAMPKVLLRDGDTVFIHPRGISVSAEGALEKAYRYEFPDIETDGVSLTELARPTVRASHVSVIGVRASKPFTRYMSRVKFAGFPLREGDAVYFHDSLSAKEIRVFVDGEFSGPKVVVAPADATLLGVLQQLEVNPGLTNIGGVSLERASVAQRQKRALEDSLRRLEESVVYSPANSQEDVKLRGAEVAMVHTFIENARKVQPSGRVVVAQNGSISNIRLEDQDRIIVPAKTNIVYVNGEVSMPQAIVQTKGAKLSYYIDRAGGYTGRADDDKILIRKVNGAVLPADDGTVIEGGDELIVLPEVSISKMQLAKDIGELIYRIAISAAVPLRFIDD